VLDVGLYKLVKYTFVGGMKIYAIIETGGKQYRVTPGQTIDVDYLDKAEGETIELDKVLLIAEDDNVVVGTPVIEGAKVMATSKGNGRAKKIIVFKYKSKVRYRKKTGHRQSYTRLTVGDIIGSGSSSDKPEKKATRRKKEVIESGT